MFYPIAGNSPQSLVPVLRGKPSSPSLLTEAQIAFLQSLRRSPTLTLCHLLFFLAPSLSSVLKFEIRISKSSFVRSQALGVRGKPAYTLRLTLSRHFGFPFAKALSYTIHKSPFDSSNGWGEIICFFHQFSLFSTSKATPINSVK